MQVQFAFRLVDFELIELKQINASEWNYVNEESSHWSWEPSRFVTDEVGVNFGLNLG
jgi:hypothetical protein